MKRILTPFGTLAAIAGLGAMNVDMWSNVEFMAAQTQTLYDSSVAAVIAVGCGTAIALTAALEAWRYGNRAMAVMLFAGYVLGAGFSLTATLDRVASQRDAQLNRVWKADDELQDHLRTRRKVVEMATRECASGIGDKCRAIRGEVEIAEEKVARRKSELDSMGQRIAAMLPWVTPETASRYQPVLLPFALFILGNWLFAFGISGRPVEKDEFDTELSGQAAMDAKVIRFASEFRKRNGRPPYAGEIRDRLQLNVTPSQATRLAKIAANAA